MSTIKPGDRIRPTYLPERHAGEGWTVIAIHDNRAWAQFIESDGRIRDDVFLLMNITKIVPRFEVGKKYELVNRGMFPERCPVTVTDVNDEWAIGWWANGEPWNRRHHSLGDSWQEVQ